MEKSKFDKMLTAFTIAYEANDRIEAAIELIAHLETFYPTIQVQDRKRLFVLLVDFQDAIKKYNGNA